MVYGHRLKVHTLDIAPLHSESPLQKRSGMARVLRGHTATSAPRLWVQKFVRRCNGRG